MQRDRKNIRNSEMVEIVMFELSTINYKSFSRKTLGTFRNSRRLLYNQNTCGPCVVIIFVIIFRAAS